MYWRMLLPQRPLGVEQLDGVSGGARIGQGEGWGDWFRRQAPFGDWRTEDQKLNDFKAWDDWNRANGLPGAFGEEPRLKGNETFLNPREISQDNLWGPTREELQGLRDLRDGPPDGSAHPTPWAVPHLDAFIKDAEQNRDGLGIDTFGRPGYDPDAGLPAERRADAPTDGSTVAAASYDFDRTDNGNGVGTEYAATDAAYQPANDAGSFDTAYADNSYADASYDAGGTDIA
jgi:hypothetical protein